jgi:hypothetical protein
MKLGRSELEEVAHAPGFEQDTFGPVHGLRVEERADELGVGQEFRSVGSDALRDAIQRPWQSRGNGF